MIAPIIDDPLSLSAAVECVNHSGAGALVTFEGVVRDHSHDTSGQPRSVHYLEYEAYRPMAEREMARVISEVEARWKVRCAASHRVGKLQIGDTAVVIAVSGAHRGEAFEACRFAIDRIKETVPIWKKEFARDGFWWVENPVEGNSVTQNSAAQNSVAKVPVEEETKGNEATNEKHTNAEGTNAGSLNAQVTTVASHPAAASQKAS